MCINLSTKLWIMWISPWITHFPLNQPLFNVDNLWYKLVIKLHFLTAYDNPYYFLCKLTNRHFVKLFSPVFYKLIQVFWLGFCDSNNKQLPTHRNVCFAAARSLRSGFFIASEIGISYTIKKALTHMGEDFNYGFI